MYLRYREPSWELAEAAEGAPSPAADGRARRGDRAGKANGKPLPSIQLNGVRLHALTEADCVGYILSQLEAGRGGMVVTPNLDHLRRYCHDLSFGALIAEADVVVADGMPLVWASRLQGTPLPQRVPGSNLISSLSAAAGAKGRSVFLLGGDPGTAEGAARCLKQEYPTTVVAGTHYPPFGFEHDPKEMSLIIQALSDAKPDIIYVALGSPKQEKLIARLRPILPAAWWMGVGNSFSFLSGNVKRAPIWMQRIGMEWLHRLFQEPRRLFRRYLIVGVPFAMSLLGRSAVKGIPNRLRGRKFDVVAPPAPIQPAAVAPASPAVGVQPPPDVRQVRSEWPAAPAILLNSGTEPAPLSRLRAMVLLGGSVRANVLSASTLRSVLDLPLDEKGSLLNHWLGHATELARWGTLPQLPVRVMVNQNAPEPTSAAPRYFGTFRVERDLSDYRGTGGVLRDLAVDYDDEDVILVANAAQVLLDPLPNITTALERKGGDIAVISHEDGTPSGIMLVTCKTLRLIPPRGFVDMKEQALPLIAGKFDVRVMQRRRPTGLPVRSLQDYIQALRYHHRRKSGRVAATDPLAEDWSPTFSLVEPGASVDHSARVHDSVVLRGARVEPGAVLVRSVVCPDATVGRDRTAVDQLVVPGPKPRGTSRELGALQRA